MEGSLPPKGRGGDGEGGSQTSRESMLLLVSKDGMALQSASQEMRADREVVFAAVSQTGRALQFASAKFKSERAMVVAACGSFSPSLEYADPNLAASKDFVLELIDRVKILKLSSPFVRRFLVLFFIQCWVLSFPLVMGLLVAFVDFGSPLFFFVLLSLQDIFPLHGAPLTIRQDPDVIMAAVKKNGLQLEYADKLLRNNKEIVMEAVQKAGKALRWASQELRNDKEVVLAAIGQVRCV